MFYVYLITNLINSFKYVGKAGDPLKRFGNHKYNAITGSTGCRYLYNAMRKDGIDNFKFEVMEECETESLSFEREIYWIDKLETFGPKGYNLTKGGEGSTGLMWIPTEENLLNMSMAHKKRYEDPLERQKTSILTKKSWENPLRKEKQIKALRNRPDKSIAIIVIDKNGNEEQYPSQQEAARQLSLSQAHICSVLKGKRKQHKGYTFRLST